MTQLLVSVRNAAEAIAAVQGGADIVDVKEPRNGSLGCAPPEVISEIAAVLKTDFRSQPPLSLALGELYEWRSKPRQRLRNAIRSTSPQFLKLGLAGIEAPSDRPTSLSNKPWLNEWQHIRAGISGRHTWVAVAYADSQQAASPGVEDVLTAAIGTGCGILLIDTHIKNGLSLSDHLTLAELQTIRSQTARHGLKLALAGCITLANLSQALSIQPDIIAVRGAVCERGHRTGTVSLALVQGFREAISQGQNNEDPLTRSV